MASPHHAPNLDQGSFYRELEPKLAEAQRRGRKRQVRSIHAKIAAKIAPRQDREPAQPPTGPSSRPSRLGAGPLQVLGARRQWVAHGRSAQSNQSKMQTAHRTP